ncbi:MAG TPA: copper amine oxidase N-terminal domain-containing protein [Armatimonadota bacterium]|nr:copper amine oxidase N-terminal domain-containing protein [Armatimonadota bacterium]
MPYMIGGRQVQLQDEPRNMNGPIYVPLRELVEAIGGSASWDPGSKTAGATLNGHHARVPNGSTAMDVDGQQKSMSVPSMMDGDTFWVPIEFFGVAFGVPVYADTNTNTVTVDTSSMRAAA